MNNIIRTLNLLNEDNLTLEKSEERIVYSIMNISMLDIIRPECTTGVCDIICSPICGKVCDQICGDICDQICDKICDVFCDTVYPCDINFVCGRFCDRVIW